MPVKITFFGSAPALITLSSSPPETMSNPLPLLLNNFSMEILLKDFTEKQIKPLFFLNAFEYASKLSMRVFCE